MTIPTNSHTLEPLRFAVPANILNVTLRLPDGAVVEPRLAPITDNQDVEESFQAGGYSVILRRVFCTIRDGLLRQGERDEDSDKSTNKDKKKKGVWKLSPYTRAALLWRAYRRYSELVGLKRLSGGLSGSAVLVFRPRLKVPPPENPRDPDLASAGPADVLRGAWGSPLLVKAGEVKDLRQEWTRSERFLRDRQSPFIARIEEFLTVHPADPPVDPPADDDPPESQGVLISSFLGGDVVQAEPLDKVIRGTRDIDRCLRILDQIAGHLCTWHTNSTPRPLAEWPRAFRFADALPPVGFDPEKPAAPWLLFGKFDFRKQRTNDVIKDGEGKPVKDALAKADGQPSDGRLEFAAGLRWEVPFGKEEHLAGHLLGKGGRRDGLLHRLMAVPVNVSLVHGDLNPRNVLCDADKSWLIDFQHTGAGPILSDFARLEANLRLWCIDLGEAGANAVEAAAEFERLLLDHFHGSESSLEPVRRFARALGADPDELEKVARCITHLRRQARRWCVTEHVDGRDYLAVLYLTLLSLLQYAGQGHSGGANLRWAVGLFWVLEEALDRLLDREPFDREQLPYDPLRQVSAEWLREAGAAGRVHRLCGTADGREVFAPVVGLRGVLQGGYHHLDAYHHTLAVLAYLEGLLEDPVGGLLNPAALDASAVVELADAGQPLPPQLAKQVATPVNADWLTDADRAAIKELLAADLTDESRLLLKWCAVLHDVGKPGTRTNRLKGDAEEVQFIGHEVYGLTLLAERLEKWFPVSEARISDLIRNHHRSHQLIGDGLLKSAKRVDGLKRLLRGERDPDTLQWLWKLTDTAAEEYRPDLSLLLLHGYADRLAARGVKQSQPVADWAEATLLLLAALARLPEFVTADTDAKGQEKVIAAAAQRYAEELQKTDAVGKDKKSFGRTMGMFREEAAGQTGTAEEVYKFLRREFPPEEVRRRLAGGE